MRTPLLLLPLILDLEITRCFSEPPNLALQLHHCPRWAQYLPPDTRPDAGCHPHVLPPLPPQAGSPRPCPHAPDSLFHPHLHLHGRLSLLDSSLFPPVHPPEGPTRVFLDPELTCPCLLPVAPQDPWTEPAPLALALEAPLGAGRPSLQGCLPFSFSFLCLHSSLSKSYLHFLHHRDKGLWPWS